MIFFLRSLVATLKAFAQEGYSPGIKTGPGNGLQVFTGFE